MFSRVNTYEIDIFGNKIIYSNRDKPSRIVARFKST